MSTDETVAALTRRVAELTDRLGTLEDIQAVRTLHFKYGYYMDKCLFAEVIDLFAEDCELRFMGGIFRGKQSARRLYGGVTGLKGPAPGMMFEHLLVQDIVDVAPDRLTARGRFRCFLHAGIHDSNSTAPTRIPRQFWEGGVYENTFVKDQGIWKIKIFNYNVVFQARYENGWAHSEPGPLMVSRYTQTYPENPSGPDELAAEPPVFWPETFVVPFHYPHPVTGKWRDEK